MSIVEYVSLLGRKVCLFLKGIGRKLFFNPGKKCVVVVDDSNNQIRFVLDKALDEGLQVILVARSRLYRQWFFCHRLLTCDTHDMNKAADIAGKIKSFQVSGVLTGCDQVLLPFVAELSRMLNLKSITMDNACSSINKLDAYLALGDNANSMLGVCDHKSMRVLSRIDNPVVLKPNQGKCSHGLLFFETGRQAADYWLKYSSSKDHVEYLYQEKISGVQYDLEGITVNGKHRIYCITWEHYLNSALHTQPAFFFFNPPMVDKDSVSLMKYVLKALDALKVTAGAWHMEVRMTPEGRICWLDWANRFGGQGFYELISKVTKRDFVREYVEAAVENKKPAPLSESNLGYIVIYFPESADLEYWRNEISLADDNLQVQHFYQGKMSVESGKSTGYCEISGRSREKLYEWFEPLAFNWVKDLSGRFEHQLSQVRLSDRWPDKNKEGPSIDPH